MVVDEADANRARRVEQRRRDQVYRHHAWVDSARQDTIAHLVRVALERAIQREVEHGVELILQVRLDLAHVALPRLGQQQRVRVDRLDLLAQPLPELMGRVEDVVGAEAIYPVLIVAIAVQVEPVLGDVNQILLNGFTLVVEGRHLLEVGETFVGRVLVVGPAIELAVL